jgi:hypothetical protein
VTLPGSPGPKLQQAYEELPADYRQPFRNHLLGGTSADWLSHWLGLASMPVSATTIRTYRRALQKGV